MNEKIAQWFQDNKFYEAFSGDGDYFVMDHTYRSHHDLILVLSTMIDWAFEKNEVISCAKKFTSALIRIIKENPVKALSIINGYLLVSTSPKQQLPINFEYLRDLLEVELKNDKKIPELEKYQIESLTEAISKKLPLFNKLQRIENR
jgi:hypothetical protein